MRHVYARLQHRFDMEAAAFDQLRADLRAAGAHELSVLPAVGLLGGIFILAAIAVAALPSTGAFQ